MCAVFTKSLSAVVLLLFCVVVIVYGLQSELKLLHDAVEESDAACLDGSPPGYYYRRGKVNKWLIHLEGGGWCSTRDDCYDRSNSPLGSSNEWEKVRLYNNGVLSDNPDVNPDLYEWNSVYVRYCDGASFAGYRSEPLVVQGKKLYFRGFPILTAVIKSLLDMGLKDGDEAILSGCSAGGLGVYYHLDYVRSLLPSSVKLSGLADAGYFINASSVNGDYPDYENTVAAFKVHNTTLGENAKCVADHKGNEPACLYATIVYPYIKTPVFAFNSQYDTWQLDNILQVNCLPPSCSKEELKLIQDFRRKFLNQAQPIIKSETNGAFLDSCFAHCQSEDDHSWSEVMIKGRTAVKTFGDWYFNRGNLTKEIDCQYPCKTSSC